MSYYVHIGTLQATSSDATLSPSVNTTAAVWIQTHAFTPSKHIEAWSLVKSAATWIGNFRPGHCYKQKQSFWAPCRLIALKALNDLCRNWEHMRDRKDMSFFCFGGIKSLQDWGERRFKTIQIKVGKLHNHHAKRCQGLTTIHHDLSNLNQTELAWHPYWSHHVFHPKKKNNILNPVILGTGRALSSQNIFHHLDPESFPNLIKPPASLSPDPSPSLLAPPETNSYKMWNKCGNSMKLQETLSLLTIC